MLHVDCRLIDCITKCRRSEEEPFVLDPYHLPQIDFRELEQKDLNLADAELDVERVGANFGDGDWEKMDREIMECIGEDSSAEDNSGDEEWPNLDEEIEKTLKQDEESIAILTKRKFSDLDVE
jgi:hypothetical protein